MNKPNDIWNELQELSPVLNTVPKTNVFSVPDGYFEQLSSLILLQTAPLKKSNSVPDGYFDNLASNIMARIRQDAAVENTVHSSVLADIGNKNVFTVPAGYFEALPENILASLKNETVSKETLGISELVAGVGNKNVFTVPTNYFDNLVTNIQSQINSPAKVVKMGVRKTILKYAAAAVVTGLLATSALFIYNKNKAIKPDAETVQLMAAAKEINKTNSFDKELNTISDADIVNYLEDKGQDVDAALVASLTDDDEKLPDPADYIIDETTLDNMLKELDLNN